MIVQKKSKYKLKTHFLFFSFLFAFASLWGSQDPSKHQKYESFKKLLPADDTTITSIEDLCAGVNTDISLCKTSKMHYLLRSPKAKKRSDFFTKMMHVHQVISEQKNSPKVYNYDHDSQQILMEYIENKQPWPRYEESPALYHETVRALRQFHETVSNPNCFSCNYPRDYWPFGWLSKHPFNQNPQAYKIPEQLTQAYARIKVIAGKFAPAPSKRPSVCHGDFHQGNILLESNGNGIRPKIIDFDTIEYGDHFYDLARFTNELHSNQHLALLKTYLGEREPTQDEIEHYSVIYSIHTVVDSTIRLETLNNKQQLPTQTNHNAQAHVDFTYAVKRLDQFLKNTQHYSKNETIQEKNQAQTQMKYTS